MKEDFVQDYVCSLVEQGITRKEDMVSFIEGQISNLDEEIAKINALYTQKTNLLKVLKMFGTKESVKETAKDIIDASKSIDELGNDREIVVKVTRFLSDKDKVSPRDVMDALGGMQEKVYLTIKWLTDRGEISRDESRKIVKTDRFRAYI